MMAARSIVLPLVGVVFGGWFWLEGILRQSGVHLPRRKRRIFAVQCCGVSALYVAWWTHAWWRRRLTSMAILERGGASVKHPGEMVRGEKSGGGL
jgi:hypothetical protein